MGIPTTEVGYTSATTGRETTKSMMDMWWHWITNNKQQTNIFVVNLLPILDTAFAYYYSA
jgi:hypothetical protein